MVRPRKISCPQTHTAATRSASRSRSMCKSSAKWRSAFGENCSEGRRQIGVQKPVAKFFQSLRCDALAGEEQRVGHFAQREPQGKGGSREERGTVDGFGEEIGEH